MPAFIYRKSVYHYPEKTVSEVYFWNRRKKVWQENLTNSCLYPTFRGTKQTALKLFNAWQNMHPHDDCIGQYDLESFARDQYRTCFL